MMISISSLLHRPLRPMEMNIFAATPVLAYTIPLKTSFRISGLREFGMGNENANPSYSPSFPLQWMLMK